MSPGFISRTLIGCAIGGLLAWSGYPIALVGVIAAAATALLFAQVSIREPMVLIAVMLVILAALPPFYFAALGETPFYASFLLFPLALAVAVVRFPDLRWKWDSVGKGLAAFLAGTLVSIPFAFWLSGTTVGLGSLSRWVFLIHAAIVYYLVRAYSVYPSWWTERRIFRLLLAGAVFSAAYGIVDFVWPIPLPHPAADQFIWLEGAVVRRAQGVFYESSNFANFCGFFLIAAAAAYVGRRERHSGVPRWLLLVFISILGLAVLVAFSRSTWASVLMALFICMLLGRFVRPARALAVIAALLVPLVLLWTISPDLWDYVVNARVGRLFEILYDPNSATSGRFDTWIRVIAILREHPQYLLFGIGYKTLTVTRLFHGEIITDNGYLSLLLETGIAGLAGFLAFSAAILRTFFRIARSIHDVPAFWATVLFAIWCGELVQLLASDAYTYWRNISVFSAMMALTLNLAERAQGPGETA